MTCPHEDHSLEVALMAFQCVTGKSIAYASTPISGGPALLEGRKDCLAFNIVAAHKFVKHVTTLSGKTVINPGEFMLDGWKQETYLYLWKTVIEKVASEVWFNEGWQFSNGCAIEFAFACHVGKKLLILREHLYAKIRLTICLRMPWTSFNVQIYKRMV